MGRVIKNHDKTMFLTFLNARKAPIFRKFQPNSLLNFFDYKTRCTQSHHSNLSNICQYIVIK